MTRAVVVVFVLLVELSLVFAAGWATGAVSLIGERLGSGAGGEPTASAAATVAAASGAVGEPVRFDWERRSTSAAGTITVNQVRWQFSGDNDSRAGLQVDLTVTLDAATTSFSDNTFSFVTADGRSLPATSLGAREPEFSLTTNGPGTTRGWLRFDAAIAPTAGTLVFTPFIAVGPVVAIAIPAPGSIPRGQPIKPGTRVDFDIRTVLGDRIRGRLTVYDSEWTLAGDPRKAWLYVDVGLELTSGSLDVYYHAFRVEQGDRSESGSVLAQRTPSISGMSVTKGRSIRGWVNFDVERVTGTFVLRATTDVLATIPIAGG